VEKPAEITRAVDLGLFQYVARHAIEAGKNDDGSQGKQTPDIDQDDGKQRKAAATQPEGIVEVAEQGAGMAQQAKAAQHPVDWAEGRIQHPKPGDGAQRGGRGPGQQYQKPDQPFSPGRTHQQLGLYGTQYQHPQQCARGNQEGIAHGPHEIGCVQQCDEIFQPDVAHHGAARGDVIQAVDYRQHYRDTQQ
jgi:hypothetical protein